MQAIQDFIDDAWASHIQPSLMDYIRIPCKSPGFDPEWEQNGHMERAVQLLVSWCKNNAIPGMTLEVLRLPKRTPVILIDVPGQSDRTILLYGHLDKQPEMTGWAEGLSPWEPVLRGDKLYGRGGADDGYSIYAALTALRALHAHTIPHDRCVILIEASEESGSADLPFYIDTYQDKIGTPDLVICLDSGCGNYEQLWLTTSLRGIVCGTLEVQVLSDGIHSGYGSGVAPCSFRIMRQLLSRVEDENTGDILLPELCADIPEWHQKSAQKTADILGSSLVEAFPFCDGVHPVEGSYAELLLNKTWRPTLSVVGADGLPLPKNAGNVLRPFTTVKLSFRIPPSCSAEKAEQALKKAFETNPPYGARVKFELGHSASGWQAPTLTPALEKLFDDTSKSIFSGKSAAYIGEGGSIPFMGMLGKKFPQAQFMVTGVLGPHSNAHGPNEFLHVPMTKKLIASIAQVLKGYHTLS